MLQFDLSIIKINERKINGRCNLEGDRDIK